jgi:hypothetical protein
MTGLAGLGDVSGLMQPPEVKVNGIWITDISDHWQLTSVEWQRPLGDYAMEWEMQLGAERPAALAAGGVAELWLAGARCWRGRLPVPDFSTSAVDTGSDGEQTFTAAGDYDRLDSAYALDNTGATTLNLHTAAGNAVIRGVASLLSNGAPNAAWDVDTSSTPTVGALLDGYANEQNTPWAVHAGQLALTSDPAAVAYEVLEPADVLGYREPVVGSLLMRWQDTPGVLHTTRVGAGAPEAVADFTGLGPLTAARITAIGLGIIAKLGGAYAWTNALTIPVDQLVNLAGVPPHPVLFGSMVAQGVRVRFPQADHVTNAPNLVQTIGGVRWSPVDRTYELSPVGLVQDEDDLDSAVAAAGGELA